jgi:hypothetical protein
VAPERTTDREHETDDDEECDDRAEFFSHSRPPSTFRNSQIAIRNMMIAPAAKVQNWNPKFQGEASASLAKQKPDAASVPRPTAIRSWLRPLREEAETSDSVTNSTSQSLARRKAEERVRFLRLGVSGSDDELIHKVYL